MIVFSTNVDVITGGFNLSSAVAQDGQSEIIDLRSLPYLRYVQVTSCSNVSVWQL